MRRPSRRHPATDRGIPSGGRDRAFEAALEETERDLLALKRSVQERIGPRESDIFTAQALVLRDPSIKQKVGASFGSNR